MTIIIYKRHTDKRCKHKNWSQLYPNLNDFYHDLIIYYIVHTIYMYYTSLHVHIHVLFNQTLHRILILNKFRYITSVLDERFRGTQKQE